MEKEKDENHSDELRKGKEKKNPKKRRT